MVFTLGACLHQVESDSCTQFMMFIFRSQFWLTFCGLSSAKERTLQERVLFISIDHDRIGYYMYAK